MRRMVVVGMSLLVSAAIVGGGRALVQQVRFRQAVAAAASAPDEAAAPIPQDAAASEKRRLDRLTWNRRTLQGAYDEIGKKDARWDEPVRKTMELAARMFSGEVDPAVTLSDVYTAAKVAVDAGCDDPMLAYLYSRTSAGPNDPGAEEAIRRAKDSAKALAASRYPPVRRAVALQVSGSYALSVDDPSDEARKEAERDFDAALALLKDSVAGDERNELWEAVWLNTLLELIRGYRFLGTPVEAAYERVDAGLAELADAKVLRLLFRGAFWYGYGWDARTTRFAANVSQKDFDAFESRLAVSRKAYEEAWRLRPGLGSAARSLLEIDKSIGGDRATMERWFDRAMKADGDDRSACWTKLDWLDPKWHGTAEEMLAFGRACRDTKNWRSGITLLVGDAHWRIACKLGGTRQVDYMQMPAVWADIQPVYDEYLKHYPNDDVARSKFAAFCYLGGHYREAEAQFVALGDRLTEWTEFPYVPLRELKRNREHTAEILVGNPSPVDVPGWHFIGAKIKDGQWKVNIPVAAERKQEPGILGAKTRYVLTCAADGVSYMIRVQPVPPEHRNEGVKHVLDAARASFVAERGGRPRDLRDAKLAYRPAQEYSIDAADLRPKLVLVRTAVIGTGLYELSATASEADLAGKAVNDFFDSFMFRDQPSPSPDAGQQ